MKIIDIILSLLIGTLIDSVFVKKNIMLQFPQTQYSLVIFCIMER